MNAVQAAASRLEAVEAFAVTCYPIEGARDVIMVADYVIGSRLPDGSPSGLGGHTSFGVAWLLEWRKPSEPIAMYDSMSEARYLYALLSGEKGELWKRRQRKLAKIAELDAAELAAAIEAKAEAKVTAKMNEPGSGSSRRKRSSVKSTASTGTSSDATQTPSRRAYATTVSRRRSSSSAKSRGSSRGSTGPTTSPSSIATA